MSDSLSDVMSDASSVCKVEGCGGDVHSRGYCMKHYMTYWRDRRRESRAKSNENRPCSMPGCSRPHEAKGLCAFHYNRRLQHRDLNAPHRFADRFAVAQEAWIRFSDAEGDEDYAKAKLELEKAMVRFADWARSKARSKRIRVRNGTTP